MMSDRILYNAQKSVIEEVKQELLKTAETEHQRNVIKEVCRSVARKHKFDDSKLDETDISKGKYEKLHE